VVVPGIIKPMIGLFGLKSRRIFDTHPKDLWCFQDGV
jgi:hypothetical protein